MIHIVPRDRARAAMAHAGPGASLISIRSFVPSGLESEGDPLADLRPTVISFDDVDRDLPMHGYVAPTRPDVMRLLFAGREHRHLSMSRCVPLVIHCAAGISRSAAAAIAINMDARGVPYGAPTADPVRREAALAVADVLGWLDVTEDAGLRRGGIHPNMAIIRHADGLLHMRGALVAAVESVPWAGTHDRFTRRLIADRLRSGA